MKALVTITIVITMTAAFSLVVNVMFLISLNLAFASIIVMLFGGILTLVIDSHIDKEFE